MPAVAVPSFAESSVLQRAPLSISADESHGLKAFTISGSQSRRATATAWLRLPCQLMKMFMVYRIVVPACYSCHTFGPQGVWASPRLAS
jgi:hypothetical protein